MPFFLTFIGYIRVSTTKQAVDGNSLVGQKAQIREYVKARGSKVSHWFSDEASARNEEEGVERPEFKKARDLSLKTGKPILVADLSRFARTETTLDDFINAGGKIYGLDGFGEDEALMRARIKRAKIDGDHIAERTRRGQEKARAAGKRFGTPTPQNGAKASAIVRGKDADLRQLELERLRDQAAKDGVESIKDFTGWLNGKGHSATEGRPWTPANVRRVLKGRKLPMTVPEPPIAIGEDKVEEVLQSFGEDDIDFLPPEEVEIVEKVLRRARNMDEKRRAQWTENLKRKWPRYMRDRLLKKAREALQSSELHPDWGKFSSPPASVGAYTEPKLPESAVIPNEQRKDWGIF